MRFLAFNDLHMSDKAPASRTDNYTDELFELLDQIERAAYGGKFDGILIAGDIFHRKPGINLAVLARLAAWCRRLLMAGCPVIAIPGNHDLRYDRYESLLPNPITNEGSTQPLAFLFDMGLMLNVSTLRTNNAGLPLGLANPAKQPYETCIWGVPFPDAFDMDQWVAVGKAIAVQRQAHPENHHIVLGHCFASLDGGDYFGEPVHSYGLLSQLVPADVFVFGHDHGDGGIVTLNGPVGEQFFVNLGALSRGSLTDEDISRAVSVAIINTDPLPSGARPPASVNQAALGYRPASELFDLQKRARLQQEHTAITAFVQQLRTDLAALGQTTDLDAQLNAMSLPVQVRAKVAEYLTAVEA